MYLQKTSMEKSSEWRVEVEHSIFDFKKDE